MSGHVKYRTKRASPNWTATATQLSNPRQLQLLVDDDGVAHYPWVTVDDYGWYLTLCGKEHPGPLVLRNAITCIECLVKHESRD